jgi:hypothetical protein
MHVANGANVGNPANVADGANVANGVLRQVAVPPRQDAAVVLWPALFAADSLFKGIGKRGLESSGGARKRFPGN